jgi:hypothetical protein
MQILDRGALVWASRCKPAFGLCKWEESCYFLVEARNRHLRVRMSRKPVIGCGEDATRP